MYCIILLFFFVSNNHEYYNNNNNGSQNINNGLINYFECETHAKNVAKKQ